MPDTTHVITPTSWRRTTSTAQRECYLAPDLEATVYHPGTPRPAPDDVGLEVIDRQRQCTTHGWPYELVRGVTPPDGDRHLIARYAFLDATAEIHVVFRDDALEPEILGVLGTAAPRWHAHRAVSLCDAMTFNDQATVNERSNAPWA